jgi:hypothetical protein
VSEAADELTDRLRALLGHRPGITEKRMMGGSCFMHHGNMICGALKSGGLLVRTGPDLYAAALDRPGAQAMHQGERQVTGFVEVTDDLEDEDNLKSWVDFVLPFVKSLPPKPEKKAAAKPRKAAKKQV